MVANIVRIALALALALLIAFIFKLSTLWSVVVHGLGRTFSKSFSLSTAFRRWLNNTNFAQPFFPPKD